MGLLARLSGQQQDLIKWDSQKSDILLFRIDNNRQLIKKGALLYVTENQIAVISSKARAADVFTAGEHTLDSKTLPGLLKIQSLNKSYSGPFIADVIFFNLQAFADLHWKSTHPVVYIDPKYGKIHVRLRGSTGLRIHDPVLFLSEIRKQHNSLLINTVREQLSDIIISNVCLFLKAQGVSLTDMEAKLPEVEILAEKALKKVLPGYGLDIAKIHISHISTPDSLKQISIEREDEPGLAAAGSQITPPPMPGQSLYYTAENGEQKGPYNLSQLADKLKNNDISPETYVWTSGMENWQKMTDVSGLVKAVRSIV